ncbi:transcriptional regulator [Streptomyces sp. NBC_01283]|uniref:transcriptional regulator n=1 Tax=Streptomyces sp. NBC_01283 TaxID=2903812 RepID=UPI00352F514B|nr:transcriptional regulator [Streptomyces sp. NBC_01283]WSL21432.1 transcriptional regulator [Streptomyces sp. NBC_01283]
MPERTHDFGHYGARGIKGSEAVARQLDQLAGYIATPITAQRGLMARLHYLTKSDHARQAAREAGLTVTDRTIKAWLEGKRRPSNASLQQIETAYRTVRRRNVARYLLRRLNGGGGTRVEIHPFNQSRVDRRFQRVLEYRSLNIRQWDTLIRAWAAGDMSALDDAWVDAIVDLGSQWGQYEYVSAVGFAA